MCSPACSPIHAQSGPQQAPANTGEASTPVNSVPEKNQEVKDENDEYRHSPAVRKLGAMLGLNPEQAATAFTVFNFLVLAVARRLRFLLKTLPKTFRNRNTAIQKHLVDARTATEEASARLSSVEERLAKLDDQIAAMRAQAEKDAAQRRAAHPRQRRRGEAEDSRRSRAGDSSPRPRCAQRQIQQYAAELAIEQAARKLVVTAETDRLLVAELRAPSHRRRRKEGHN